MKSIIFEQFGEPTEVLQLRDIPSPEPRKGEVCVRMLASPINPSDLMNIRGIYTKQATLPATPGFEGVGIVEANGGGLLGSFLTGKRVAVLNSETGNWQEQTVVPAKQAIPLPNDLSLEQAAMFFVNPATAYIMTRKVLAVPADAWILQTAAGSALGRMVIRLGKHFGFRTLNVVRRAEQVDELKQLGGDAVLAFDPATHDPKKFVEDVKLVTNNEGVRFAIDPVGGKTGSAIIQCLAHDGQMLVYGTLSNEPLSFSPRELMTPNASIEGFWLGNWMAKQKLIGKLRLVKSITRLIRSGVLAAEVSQSFPLEEVSAAVTAAEQPARSGKILLKIVDK